MRRQPRSPVLTLLASALLATSLAAQPVTTETAESANDFLDRFAGTWIGEGELDGRAVSDELTIARALGGVFLKIVDREIGGRGFEGEMFAGWDAADGRFELWSFGSYTGFGEALPVREMAGQRDGETLVVEEAPGQRRLRYTFELLDADGFRLTKAWVVDGEARPFLVQLFRRRG